MFKNLVGIALVVASTVNLSAKEKNHVIDFDQVSFESSGRNLRMLTSTAEEPTPTFSYVFGQGKLQDEAKGKSFDLSDTRSRTELLVKTSQFYDVNSGSISFDIASLKKNFGVKGDTVIFEESNGDTSFGLLVDESGRLKIKVSAKFPIIEDKKDDLSKYDEAHFKKIDNKTPTPFDTSTAIDKASKAVEDEKKKEAEAKLAPKPTHEVKEFSFHAYEHGDTSKWNVNEFNNIVVSWDLRKGFFVVLLNGKYAIRSYASDGNKLGLYLDRGKAGEYINFGKGNDGFSAKIDNIVISKTIIDAETANKK